MIQSFEVRIGERELEVCYTARARYLFEQLAGYPLHESRAFAGKFSDVELPHLLVAGLEGSRARTKARKAPWTVDEVLDSLLADVEPDERMATLLACVKAVDAAFKKADAPEDAKGAEGKAPTTA